MNRPSEIKIAGLMSGSSLDGVDLAVVSFELDDHQEMKNWGITSCETATYPGELYTRLKDARTMSGRDLWQLHVDLGHYFARVLKEHFIRSGIKPDLIASHGHTVFHFPQHKMTCQIGDGSAMAVTCGVPVMTDFRSMDIALGGQGAPLAQLADRVLFPQYKQFLNLGGIANMTRFDSAPPTSYDMCLCNQALNHFAGFLGKDMDEGGEIAQSGHLDHNLLSFLNQLSWYDIPPPKSLDNGQVQEMIDDIDSRFDLEARVVLHTLVEHISNKIADGLEDSQKILVSGGGAKNQYLISQIEHKLPDTSTLVIPSDDIVDYKEAALMALAGLYRWQKKAIFNAQLTGARQDAPGGSLYWPIDG